MVDMRIYLGYHKVDMVIGQGKIPMMMPNGDVKKKFDVLYTTNLKMNLYLMSQ
jgi:hypothetical protein